MLNLKIYPTQTHQKIPKVSYAQSLITKKFIPSFAELAGPIMELSNLHPKEFKWTPDHEHRSEF